MSILKIGSDNPKLSFILSKNPATIRTSLEPFTRDLRKGKLYGWFSKANDSEFKLLFKDSDTEVSFINWGAYEHLDKTRFHSPYLPIAMISTALASALKQKHEADTPEFTSYIEATVKISNTKMALSCIRHFREVEIFMDPDTSKIAIQGNSIQTILNVLVVFCLIQALHDKDCYIDMNSSAIEFYLRALDRINAPYFIRYLFSRTVFRDTHTFDRYRTQIQLPNTAMNYGDTRRHRYDAITPYLSGGERLVDVGCGELFFAKRLSKKYDVIHAFDADPIVSEDAKGKVEGWHLENVTVIGEEVTANYVKENPMVFEGADILMTEIIEHMEIDQAIGLIKALMKTDFNKLVITVPNKDFNTHYDLSDDAMRHSDHHWELGLTKFSEILTSNGLLPDELIGIGDSVNGVSSSILALFKKAEVKA